MIFLTRFLDNFFPYRKLTVRVPISGSHLTKLMIERLVKDDKDGKAYRDSIFHWLFAERPIIERFIGNLYLFQIEGPILDVSGLEFPFGSQLRANCRWANLTPGETRELTKELRIEIDRILLKWMMTNRDESKTTIDRRPRRRELDDHVAVNQMVSFACQSGLKAKFPDGY